MRLLFILVLQGIGSFGLVGLGLWGLAHPVSLQSFLNENFALLPAVGPKSTVTATLIRVGGIGLILLGSVLVRSFRDELITLFGFGLISK